MLAKEMLNIEDHTTWTIENDNTADWAIERIKEIQEDYDRMAMIIKNKIQELEFKLQKEKEGLDRERGFFEGHLQNYFNRQENLKETKTQLQLKLPTGTLKLRKAKTTFEYDKAKLTEVAEQYEHLSEFIKIKKEFDWAEFKKTLVIKGNNIVDKNTGEIVDLDGLGVTEKPAEFKVEV